MQRNTNRLLVALLICLSAGALLSVAGGYGGVRLGAISLFAFCGLLAFAINWLVFIPSSMAQTERYYDLTGGLTYICVIVVALTFSPIVGARAALVATMVVVWAVRLAGFLYIRIRQDGHDDRFDQIKIDPLRFFVTWTLQGLWVFLTAACALAIITNGVNKPIGVIGSIGIAVWLLGFLCEVTADAQKRAFKRNPDHNGRFINIGLWSYSQHPNYFGEIVLWTGIAIIALPVLHGWQWLCLISPLFVYLLLTKVSGIPLLTAKAQKKWANDPAYHDYVAKTPLLVPRISSKK